MSMEQMSSTEGVSHDKHSVNNVCLVAILQLYLNSVHGYKCFKIKLLAEAGLGKKVGCYQKVQY